MRHRNPRRHKNKEVRGTKFKILATRCHILRLKCTKFDFGWGSAPDPSGEAHSAERSPDPLTQLHLRGPILLRKGKAVGGKGREGEGEEKEERGKEGMGEGEGRRKGKGEDCVMAFGGMDASDRLLFGSRHTPPKIHQNPFITSLKIFIHQEW